MDNSNAPIDGEAKVGVKQMVISLSNWAFDRGMAPRFPAHAQQAELELNKFERLISLVVMTE